MKRTVKTRRTELEVFGNHLLLGKVVHSESADSEQAHQKHVDFLCSGYDAIFDSCLLRVECSHLSARGTRLVEAELQTWHADALHTDKMPQESYRLVHRGAVGARGCSMMSTSSGSQHCCVWTRYHVLFNG